MKVRNDMFDFLTTHIRLSRNNAVQLVLYRYGHSALNVFVMILTSQWDSTSAPMWHGRMVSSTTSESKLL